MTTTDLGKLEKQLRQGEVPEEWLDTFAGADPAIMLIIIWTGRLSRRVDAFYQETLRPHGLQYSDYATLSLLLFSGSLSPKQLNSFLTITSGGLTKTIQRLEKDQLVKRSPDPADGRGTLITLSGKGKLCATRLLREDIQSHESLFSELSSAKRKNIAVTLRQLLDIFETALPT
jgi:DNA-binding MarR family transcriptional regulator